MAEATPGTVINDFGKSLPTLEDFFYNDLEGYDTQQLNNQRFNDSTTMSSYIK